MSFDLDVCLDEYSTPAGKERAATYTGQYSPSRMGMTVIPSFDSTEVSFATVVSGTLFLKRSAWKFHDSFSLLLGLSKRKILKVLEICFSP